MKFTQVFALASILFSAVFAEGTTESVRTTSLRTKSFAKTEAKVEDIATPEVELPAKDAAIADKKKFANALLTAMMVEEMMAMAAAAETAMMLDMMLSPMMFIGRAPKKVTEPVVEELVEEEEVKEEEIQPTPEVIIEDADI